MQLSHRQSQRGMGDLEHSPPTYPHVEAEHPISFPCFPTSPNTIPLCSHFFFPRLSHLRNSSLSAKCHPLLHLAVVARASVAVGVVYQPRIVLRMERLDPWKRMQMMKQTILLKERTILLHKYESIYSLGRAKY